MDNDQILTQVKFAHIFTETAVHGQSQGQLLLHLLLLITSHLVLEQLLPTHPFLWIGLQHLLYEILAHLRYVVYRPRKVEVLLIYHHLQLIDVLGVVRRPQLQQKYLPNSIQ